jgi:hypothetical protein
VAAWGENGSGQTNVPADLNEVVAVSGGAYYSLALRSNGTVVAWGDNSSGETIVPPEVSNIVAIAAARYHNLVLRDDGTVVAWGNNQYGQTNVPAGLSNVVAIACGWRHNLALRANGTVVAWGRGNYGATNLPPGLSNVVAVAGGGNHSLALRSDGTVAAWGYNQYGQTNVLAGLSNVVMVSAGYDLSMALRADGTVVAWGINNLGQTNIAAGLSNVAAVSTWGYHSLALAAHGAPHLLTPFLNRTAAFGGSAFLSMSASGARPLTYQWRCNGTNLMGATNAWLALSNVQFDQAGLYSVVVSNAYGIATSAEAQLAVLPPTVTFDATASGLSVTNGLFRMRGRGPDGWIMISDTSSNLVNWVPWQTNTFTNGWLDMQAPINPNGRQFFRLRSP